MILTKNSINTIKFVKLLFYFIINSDIIIPIMDYNAQKVFILKQEVKNG